MRVWSIVVLLSLAAEAASPAPGRTTSFTLDPQGGIVVAASFNGAGSIPRPAGYRSQPLLYLRRRCAGDRRAGDRPRGGVVAGRGPRIPNRPRRTADGRAIAVGRQRRPQCRRAISSWPAQSTACSGRMSSRDCATRSTIDGVTSSGRTACPLPGVPRSAAELPLTFRDGLPIVELRQRDSTLKLVADSGAGGLLLFESEGTVLPAMRTGGGLVRVDSFQGSRTARSVVIDEFRVGASTFQDMPAVVVKRARLARLPQRRPPSAPHFRPGHLRRAGRASDSGMSLGPD